MWSRPLVSTLRNVELLTDDSAFIRGLIHDVDQVEHHVSAWMCSWQDAGAGTAVRAARSTSRQGLAMSVSVTGTA
jgi:hypothetical protein